MKRIHLLFAVSLPLTFLLFACGGKGNHSEKFKKIVTSEDGVFRGVKFDMAMADAKKMEKADPNLDDDVGVQYMISWKDGDKDESAEINYDKEGSEIVVKFRNVINLKDNISAKDLYKEFKDYYTKKHGEPEGKEGQYRWKVNEKPSYTVELTLQEGESKIYLDMYKE